MFPYYSGLCETSIANIVYKISSVHKKYSKNFSIKLDDFYRHQQIIITSDPISTQAMIRETQDLF